MPAAASVRIVSEPIGCKLWQKSHAIVPWGAWRRSKA